LHFTDGLVLTRSFRNSLRDDESKADNGDTVKPVECRMHVISRTVRRIVVTDGPVRNVVSSTMDFGRGRVLTCTANNRSTSSRSETD